MARYKNGINGPVLGKVGTVIASSWRGIDYLKSVQKPSLKPASQAQLDMRKIFSTVSSWLRPLRLLINIGFQAFGQGKTPMNEAISLNLKEAVKGEGPDREIDFSRAVFSKGELLVSWIEEVVVLVDAVLGVIWKDAPGSVFCRETDRSTFIIYNPDQEKFVAFEGAAVRGDGEAVLQLPADFSGDRVHCYQFYINEQGDAVSSSQYLGEVLVG